MQVISGFFSTPAGVAFIALISSLIGYLLSFLTQSWLESKRARINRLNKAWEAKFETLRQFSEDLSLWLYLVVRQSNNSQTPEARERALETGKMPLDKELVDLTKKLIKKKTHLIRYPKILSQYEKVADLVEWTDSSPVYLEAEDIAAIKLLLRTIQNELQQELVKTD